MRGQFCDIKGCIHTDADGLMFMIPAKTASIPGNGPTGDVFRKNIYICYEHMQAILAHASTLQKVTRALDGTN